MNRRNFLQSAAAGAVIAAQVSDAAPVPAKTIGIQVGAVSFVDEGVEKVLDAFQQDAQVNTLFVATFTYGRGIAGRQVPGQPLPDHGKQEYDTATFKGGSYTRVHPEYYKDTVLKDLRAPDLGDFDVLESVVPAARKRGIKRLVGQVLRENKRMLDLIERLGFTRQTGQGGRPDIGVMKVLGEM